MPITPTASISPRAQLERSAMDDLNPQNRTPQDHARPRRRRRGGHGATFWSWLLVVASLSANAWAAAPVVPPEMLRYIAPQYPEAMLARGLRGEVVLQLVVELDGTVGDVTVVTSAGPAFDAAAVQAGKLLRFSPATQAGKPMRVAIQFRYAFAPEMRIDRRGRAGGLGRYDRRSKESVPSGFSSLSGRLIERGTRKLVAGALVTLPELTASLGDGAEAISDGDGVFRFGALPAGDHRVVVEPADHRRATAKVSVRDGATAELELLLTRRSYLIYRAVAQAPPEPGEMSRRSIGIEEIQKIPGVYGDAFKVVQNLPGVARQAAGIPVVRGSAPQDTAVFVEGVRIQLLYHFGGLYSILNTDLLDGIDFTPGGNPVRYGRAMGGVLAARLALPRDDAKWGGVLESNVFHTGVLIGGPIGADTRLTIAARRSYIDALVPLVVPDGALPFTQLPRYWDYQIKLDHRFSERTNATVFVFGTDDQVVGVLDKPPAAFPDARGDLQARTAFHSLIGVLRHNGDGWSSRTTLGAVRPLIDTSLGTAFKLSGDALELTVRQAFTLFEGPVQLRTGFDFFYRPFSVDIVGPPFAFSGERGTTGGNPPSGGSIGLRMEGTETQPAAWVDSIFRVGALELVPGVRFDLFRGLSRGDSVSPRINGRYRLRDGLTLKAATGLTSQPAQPPQLVAGIGTPSLGLQKSWEAAGGFEATLTDTITLDIQVFYKRQWDLVVPSSAIIPDPIYSNIGRGRIVGLELLARHKPVGRFFGWVAYTLQRAERQDKPGADWRLFGWDQTHILTALGTWKLPWDLEFGFRFRLTSGNPTTALATAVYNEKTDSYTRVQSATLFGERLPTFAQLDLRIDRRFAFDRFLLDVYLDVQNVTNRENAEFVQYNFDASVKRYGSGLPIIPSLGVRASF
jgi:TonB family protein